MVKAGARIDDYDYFFDYIFVVFADYLLIFSIRWILCSLKLKPYDD